MSKLVRNIYLYSRAISKIASAINDIEMSANDNNYKKPVQRISNNTKRYTNQFNKKYY